MPIMYGESQQRKGGRGPFRAKVFFEQSLPEKPKIGKFSPDYRGLEKRAFTGL